jgi:hypothetical protein
MPAEGMPRCDYCILLSRIETRPRAGFSGRIDYKRYTGVWLVVGRLLAFALLRSPASSAPTRIFRVSI